jgi:hypothetical protein
MLLLVMMVLRVAALAGQDATPVYPWRLSYFPYPTVSPNDGVMGIARAVWFRQSRWDDRVSVHDQVAIEAGYSTKDAWLARVRGDFPRLADGWRLQAIAQAEGNPAYFGDGDFVKHSTRQVAAAEVTRQVRGPLSVAVRTELTHLSIDYLIVPALSATETDVRARLALVLDLRDREYDTRRGALLQAGMLLGSAHEGYHGWYGLASGWVPLSGATRVTARVGARMLSDFSGHPIDAERIVPAWEDEFVVGGGPESNRALPAGASTNTKVLLASAELRHDLFVFPGGAVALIGFVDSGKAYCDCEVLASGWVGQAATDSQGDWIIGAGGGVALRLLRNAVLTATVARAEHATRVYVSSGWSW